MDFGIRVIFAPVETKPNIEVEAEVDYIKGGVLLIDKPLEWTSFDVVSKIRNAIKRKHGVRLKVGHAGTLDPLASGLLIVCTGSFTKKINEFQDLEKEYEGVFVLGATRPSYDKETEINATFPLRGVTVKAVKQATLKFIGEIDQVPPVYSAIKVDGKRAYESARKGKELEMQPRKVSIRAFEVTKVELPNVHFKVTCSKGTYIRSLARDFGETLGCGAYLDVLIRTGIGHFKLQNARSIEQAQELFQITV